MWLLKSQSGDYVHSFGNVALGKSVCLWGNSLSDRYLMVDPLSYFLFEPFFHNLCNKGCGMCYPGW